ncbi:MAG: hypothetical protein IJ721_04865, partial [Bacteroidales bacterium]|nr:hypothetical protein [Bacteroidales bacterium]
RHGASYNWDEARISLNWNPLNFLSFSGSTAFRHFGRSLGAAMNFHPAGIHFILGVDYIPTRIAAIPGLDLPVDFVGLPIDGLNFNAWFGLQLAFGKRRLDYGRRYIL